MNGARRLREALGWTLERLGTSAGISRQRAHYYEHGRPMPPGVAWAYLDIAHEHDIQLSLEELVPRPEISACVEDS